jgi:hypothetical protein
MSGYRIRLAAPATAASADRVPLVRRGGIGKRQVQALVVALCLFLLASGADAVAAPPPSVPGAFRLAGSNGYELQVVGSAASHGSPSQVVVFVSKGSSFAVYTAPARATATSFEADLGSLGRIAVAYNPTGPTWKRHGTCDFPSTYTVGFYEGTIEFHGEGGYTDASASKVEATVPELPCGSGGETVGGRLPGASLSAFSFGDASRYFRVYKNAPKQPAVFSATIAEASGDVGIVREVQAKGPPPSFIYGATGKKGLEATVRPPAPFSGTARFSKRSHSTRGRLKGDLSVDFPGHPDVALVGSRTGAFLTLHTRITEHSYSPH